MNKPLISDEEYAKEAKSQSDYLNWIFGVTTFFLTLTCLQFNTPWKVAVICLGSVIPMYIYAIACLPISLRVLRALNRETKDPEVQQILAHLERKFHGLGVVYTNAILWISLLFFLTVLFSFDQRLQPLILWIKT